LINYVKVNLRHYSVISCSEAQDAQPFISVRTLPGTCSRCASSSLQSRFQFSDHTASNWRLQFRSSPVSRPKVWSRFRSQSREFGFSLGRGLEALASFDVIFGALPVRTLPDRSAGRLWRALACVIASNNNLLCGVNQVSNYYLDKEPTWARLSSSTTTSTSSCSPIQVTTRSAGTSLIDAFHFFKSIHSIPSEKPVAGIGLLAELIGFVSARKYCMLS